MNPTEFPEEERREKAVRLACRVLLANEVKWLPPDPFVLAEQMGFALTPVTAALRLREDGPEYESMSAGEEAFTLCRGGRYFIAYDDTVASPERIRFSVFHEFGHILMDHFRLWNVENLPVDSRRVLEDEASTFARNILCPPPILDWVRGDWRDPRWAKLFCLSERAWKARVRTMPVDRRCIDQKTADDLRAQFGNYMFGRRCRECGHVFTDPERRDRCPACGRGCLLWNPRMESREDAARRRHFAGAGAADLQPRVGEERDPDLTEYWRRLREEKFRGRSPSAAGLSGKA